MVLAACGSSGSSGSSTSDAASKASRTFALTSPVVAEGGALPLKYTCDGESATPPLRWSGAPQGTAGYAVIMHHVPAPGETHWYWVLYNIGASVTAVDEGVAPAAIVGTNSVNDRNEYAPPCSKGPGAKLYTFTVYALSTQPVLADPSTVTRAALLSAIDGLILGQAELNVTYSRSALTETSQP
jgi:Raf kinase inhibitor-like YbhB/YbcL family protein